MKHSMFAACLGALFCLTLSATAARAGQVVSKEDRVWAREALQEEKTLKAAPAQNTVAVLYFKNQTGQPRLDPLQKGLALMLITDLSSVEQIQVVERVRLQALVEEMGLGTSGLVEEGSAPRVGRLLGARWLLGGDLQRGRAENLKVDSAVLDVPKGQSAGQPTVEGELAELFRLEKDLLFDIVKTLRVELTPRQESRLRQPCSRSTSALLALSRAVDAADGGRFEEAAAQYEKALQEDPGVCLAAEGLRELKTIKPAPVKVQGLELLRNLRDETSLTNQLAPRDQLRRPTTPRDIPAPVDVEVTFPSGNGGLR